MNKKQLDELYHNLRELCLTEDLVQKEAIEGIVSHLTAPNGDYAGLLRFLSYYGEKYILRVAVIMLQSTAPPVKFDRVVELGAGFGWLARGISNNYDQLPTLLVDKRQWAFTDIIADVETNNGSKRVLDELKSGDLIVMSELLHCLDNPEDLLRQLTAWPLLIVEYDPENRSYRNSYSAQIAKYGCKPVNNIRDMLPDNTVLYSHTDTHGIWLVLPSP